MKKVYLAMKIDKDGYPVLYKEHPLFDGSICHDLPTTVSGNQNNRQQVEPMICPKTKVREFLSVGELQQAVTDYNRNEPKESRKDFEAFVVLEKISL